VIDIITSLCDFGATVSMDDHWTNTPEVTPEYGHDFTFPANDHSPTEGYHADIHVASHPEFSHLKFEDLLERNGASSALNRPFPPEF
jgi:hypothetical protein